MTPEEKIAEQVARLKKIKKWPARLNKLRSRKKNPMQEAEFCRKHGLPIANFNRNKKSPQTGASFPTAETVERVEKAFEAEGV